MYKSRYAVYSYRFDPALGRWVPCFMFIMLPLKAAACMQHKNCRLPLLMVFGQLLYDRRTNQDLSTIKYRTAL